MEGGLEGMNNIHDPDLRVRLECGPPEIVATTASHVIASAILLNVLATARTLLHATAQAVAVDQNELLWGLRSLLLWNPLMLANEAHGGVEPKISQANATEHRTIDLQLGREESISHQLVTALQMRMKGLNWLRQASHGLPKIGRSHQCAVWGKTTSCNVPLRAACVQI